MSKSNLYFRFLVFDESANGEPWYCAYCIDATNVGGDGRTPEEAIESARKDLEQAYTRFGERLRKEPLEEDLDKYIAVRAGEPIDDLSCIAATYSYPTREAGDV